METCFLPPKTGFSLVVGIDHATIVLVLQIVFLDVIPDFLGHFSTRQRRCTHNSASMAVGVTGFMNAAFGVRFFAGAAVLAAFTGAFLAGAALFLAGSAF